MVSAAEMLSVTAFLEGAHAQAFPSFGSERMGAPVIAFCRIDDKEIRLREPRQRHAGRRLLRARHSHHRKEKNDQKTDHPEPPLEPSATSGLTSNQAGPDPLLRNRLRRPKCFDDGQCCHIRLTASVPEVLAVLTYIRESFSTDEVEALKRKVANIDTFTRRLDGEARARQRLPCPLLKDGSCSVHPVRPLSCRAVVSVDVAACKRAYDTHMQKPVPQHELQILAANAVGYGIFAGLADAGRELEDLEFNAALALGLADEDIGTRWIKGQGGFTPATQVKKS